MSKLHRRKFLGSVAGLTALAGMPYPLLAAANEPSRDVSKKSGFRYCLNTSTIRGQKRGIWQNIEIAEKAGYDGIELWVKDIRNYLENGGTTRDLRSKLEDSGLSFENAISFPQWIVDDPETRGQAMVSMREEMEILSELGCKRIAAPPTGATKGKKIDLFQAAERYHAILELGETFNIFPILEIWGFSENVSRLGEALFIAAESNHPRASILPDVYHLYRGGSSFTGLQMLNYNAVPVFHMNDYPANIPREQLKDSDRVFPGNGIAPLHQIVTELRLINPSMVLSLELFNPVYWKMDALEVAVTGLKKMKQY